MKGPSLPRRNGSSPGTFPNEKLQAEACQSAVEAVRRITSSCSSLESSSKSQKGGMDGGDGDPTYNGFALDERGPQTFTSPPEGRETRDPENKKDSEGRGETPKGRPLPTLREIHQMNLRRRWLRCHVTSAEVSIMTTVIARQGLCWNHKCKDPTTRPER